MSLRKLRNLVRRRKGKSPIDNDDTPPVDAAVEFASLVFSSVPQSRLDVLRLATAFWDARLLSTALECDFFSALSQPIVNTAVPSNSSVNAKSGAPANVPLQGLSLSEMIERWGWCPILARTVCDFLVALQLIECRGVGSSVLYVNTSLAKRYLVAIVPIAAHRPSASVNTPHPPKPSPLYLGDALLHTCGSTQAHQAWSTYPQSLRTDEAVGNPPFKETLARFRTQLLERESLRTQQDTPSPYPLFRLGMSLCSCRVLHAAVELKLFDLLHQGTGDAVHASPAATLHQMTTLQIHNALLLRCSVERTVDFLEALVQVGLLETEIGRNGKTYYANAAVTVRWLISIDPPDENSDRIDATLVDFVRLSSQGWYPSWGAGGNFSRALTVSPERVEFLAECRGETSPLVSPSSSSADLVHTSDTRALQLRGWNSLSNECHAFWVRHPHVGLRTERDARRITIVGDTGETDPLARWVEHGDRHGASEPSHCEPCPPFVRLASMVPTSAAWPDSDVIVWCPSVVCLQAISSTGAKRLLQRAFDSLAPLSRQPPPSFGDHSNNGGDPDSNDPVEKRVLVVLGLLDERRVSSFGLGLTMQLHIESNMSDTKALRDDNGSAPRSNTRMFIFTASELCDWCRQVGFSDVTVEPIGDGPFSMMCASKGSP